MRYQDLTTGGTVNHTVNIVSPGHFLDILSRYGLTQDSISMLEVDGKPMDPGELIEKSRRANDAKKRARGGI